VTQADVEPVTWGVIQLGRSLSAAQHAADIERMRALARRIVHYEVLITPVLPSTPRPAGWYDISDPSLEEYNLRSIDRFVDLSGLRSHLRPFYSEIARPSIDPELMIRMLIVGYCFGIRSERRLCDEVHLNLAYRWSAGSAWRAMCRTTRPSPRTGTAASAAVICCASCSRRRCAGASREGLVGGEGFAVDASLIKADTALGSGVSQDDDAAWGAASEVKPSSSPDQTRLPNGRER
jgi:transposase